MSFDTFLARTQSRTNAASPEEIARVVETLRGGFGGGSFDREGASAFNRGGDDSPRMGGLRTGVGNRAGQRDLAALRALLDSNSRGGSVDYDALLEEGGLSFVLGTMTASGAGSATLNATGFPAGRYALVFSDPDGVLNDVTAITVDGATVTLGNAAMPTDLMELQYPAGRPVPFGIGPARSTISITCTFSAAGTGTVIGYYLPDAVAQELAARWGQMRL